MSDEQIKIVNEFRNAYRGMNDFDSFKQLYGGLLLDIALIADEVKKMETSNEKLICLIGLKRLQTFFELRYRQPNMEDFEFFKELFTSIMDEAFDFNAIVKDLKKEN